MRCFIGAGVYARDATVSKIYNKRAARAKLHRALRMRLQRRLFRLARPPTMRSAAPPHAAPSLARRTPCGGSGPRNMLMHQLLPVAWRAKFLPNRSRRHPDRPPTLITNGCRYLLRRAFQTTSPMSRLQMEKSGQRGGEGCAAARSSASAAIFRRQNGLSHGREDWRSHGKLGGRVGNASQI